jgi:hypothetical protein
MITRHRSWVDWNSHFSFYISCGTDILKLEAVSYIRNVFLIFSVEAWTRNNKIEYKILKIEMCVLETIVHISMIERQTHKIIIIMVLR